MEIKGLSIQEVTTFAYCSMQYRLRYVLGLPWFPASPRAAASKVVCESTREFFRLQMTARNRRVAGASAMTVLDAGAARALQAFPEGVAYLERVRRDMMYALSSIVRQYLFPRDRMIGFDIPYDAVFTLNQNKGIIIKGKLDAAFFRNVDTSFEQVVCVTIASTHDPQVDLVRYGDLHRGFARHVARDGLKLKQSIQHKFLPALRKIRHDPSHVVEDAPNLEKTSRKDTVEFYQTVVQVAKGIKAGFAVPTGDGDKCKHCPYHLVCHQRLATRDLTASELEIIEGAAETNPLYKWPQGEQQ